MITVQLETARDTLEELKPLFPKHWEEIGVFKDKVPLDPDYDEYLLLETQGKLTLATMRSDGTLLGYMVCFPNLKNLHYKSTRTARMDIIYIVPEYRKIGAGKRLVECMEAELKRRGVVLWHAGSKNHQSIEWLFLMCGFEPTDTLLSKWIGC